MTNHTSAKLLPTVGQSTTIGGNNNSINSLLISAMSNLTSSTMMNGLGPVALGQLGNNDPNGGGGATTDSGGGGNGLSTSSAAVAAVTASNVADLLLCKMITPYHIINEPRQLECGHSACANCIVSIAKQAGGSSVKCPYCSQMHKFPLDVSKLMPNRSLQTLLKFNMAQINQSFTKQLEDSMLVLERNLLKKT